MAMGPDRCGSGNENRASGIVGCDDGDYDDGCGDEMEGERSTVYVAVATWVPKCNRLSYQQQQEQNGGGAPPGGQATGVLGPTSDNTE